MACSVGQTPNLLNRRQGAVVVQARDRVVDHDDLVSEIGILVQRREEESQRERFAVAGTQSAAKGRLPFGGVEPPATATGESLITTS